MSAGTHVRESLAVHPLLNTPDTAKYVPYTPRQRQPTATTPGQPPSQSTAPTRHLAGLRAAAQTIGLDANSVGWAILEKISYEGDTSDEWTDIWNAITRARGTLLLPSEAGSGHDLITPEFVQDHLVLCDLVSRDNTQVVTLSGLRGQLANGTLTFRSTLHRLTKPFQALLTPSISRAASLDALPPLPAYPPESSYPSFIVSAFSATLPLPSRATKPPLPTRLGARGAPPVSSARLSMPFASLFGQRPSTPPPPPPTTTVTTATASTPTSTDVDATIDVSAFVIDTALSRTDIATGIISALKGELAIALTDQPPWLVERVHAFALPYLPFTRLPAGKKKLQDIGGNPANRVLYAVNGALEKPEELADKFQAFYRTVEVELRNGGRVRVEGSRSDGMDLGNQQDPGLVGDEEAADDGQMGEVLEMIEATLCTLLYDRLFLPSTSDDASHNEALSSRIAALNMLDLNLEHLDVDIGDADRREVDAVVWACGQALAELDLSARSPHEKAAVLVSAHKLVVEGLSKITQIRLKSRADDLSTEHLPSPTEPTEHASMPATSLSIPLRESTKKQSSSIPSIQLSMLPDQSSVIKESSPEIDPLPSEVIKEQNSSMASLQLSILPDQPSAMKHSAPEPEPLSASSPVSGDVLLPILIFSVVKANPARLVSHLLFTQRFRNQSFGGEESYCLINLMAVAEFLENVDLGALGLGESEKKVLSTADLTPMPIPITRPTASESPIAAVPPGEEHLASLRGRVEQGVDAIAGSANKVISGVFDTSFGVLRALLPGQTVVYGGSAGVASGSRLSASSGSASGSGAGAGLTNSGSGEADAALRNVRPGLGLLRRETGFSIAGLTAALPGGPGRTRSHGHIGEEGQRELVEVSSRPPSLQSPRSAYETSRFEDDGGSSEEESGDVGGKEDVEAEREEEEEEAEEGEEEEQVHDTRSIKSFESMLSSGRATRSKMRTASGTSLTSPPATTTTRRRKRLTDLTDRLTHGMAGMSRRVQGGDVPRSSSSSVVLSGRLLPPNRRFVECTEQDIRVSEVGELLREYQRLVEAVRTAGGFQE